jgi:glutamate synthase domain-containing protein 2
MRKIFFVGSALILGAVAVISVYWPPILFTLLVFGPLFLLGLADSLQERQSIRRNFPLLGHFRYLLEEIRPEIQQYFIEANTDGMPFSREKRSLIYQRAKRQLDSLPFGTQLDVYQEGYEWINHSLAPTPTLKEQPRHLIGEKNCKLPYSASIFNISAMSYGSLSKNAILALNKGAKLGSFAHNTGEGGLSPHHLQNGGDLIWQIGTGYFSCRTPQGNFDPARFKENAARESVRMIELKLSQGAKPGHGGILPAKKLTPEIISIRGVSPGKDVISPPSHTAFSSPVGLLEFIAKLREYSGGKPVGFKLCLGKRREFLSICKAMIETQITPDFITIDGAEGGTGAAPLEFSNSVGTPLRDALIFIHNSLVGINVRKDIRIIVSGKVVSGFQIAQNLALGADMCNSARGMMFALGCIQALRCNSNNCPTGVATQDPALVKGLVVSDKAVRVANFHKETIHSFLDMLSAGGLKHPSELRPWHLMRRVNQFEVKHYGEIYQYLEPGQLLAGDLPSNFLHAWKNASASVF